jgi:hypothetical protein
MASITLTDTGKYDTGQLYQTDAEVTSEEKSYGSDGVVGTALNLNVYSVTLNEKAGINNEPALQNKDDNSATGSFKPGEADMTSTGFNNWTLMIAFDTKLTTDLQAFGRLMHMCTTKGYKELRFLASGTKEIPYILTYSQYGKREYDELTTKTVGDTDTPINVRITDKTVKQTVKEGSKIIFTLKLIETD